MKIFTSNREITETFANNALSKDLSSDKRNTLMNSGNIKKIMLNKTGIVLKSYKEYSKKEIQIINPITTGKEKMKNSYQIKMDLEKSLGPHNKEINPKDKLDL